MPKSVLPLLTALAALLTPLLGRTQDAGTPSVLPLVDFTAAGSESRLIPSAAEVTLKRSDDPAKPGAIVTVQPGTHSYPGLNLKPSGSSTWDLSKYGHVEARAANTGTKPFRLALRVDDANDTDAESVVVKPGTTGTAIVWFGYNYRKPDHPVQTNALTNILLFIGKSAVVQSFRLELIAAGGPPAEKPPFNPDDARIKPESGYLLGPGISFDPQKQLKTLGVEASLSGTSGALRIQVPAKPGEKSVVIRPPMGRWDLRDFLEMHVKLRNEGPSPISPRVQLQSDGGTTDAVIAPPLDTGKETEIVVPFAPASRPKLIQPGITSGFVNDAASSVTVSLDSTNGTFSIESIQAVVPPNPVLPNWLGNSPPVKGDWVQTFDEEFNGDKLDASKWNVYTQNVWDKKSHFSKDNVTIANGVATLRFERKRGHPNDDPTDAKETDYTTGYLDTYGKWTQKYGYFEARMKLPTAPGLWPAFWLMPDRGGKGPQWTRQSTKNGGMEFDIMEYLSRWGPYRYNIAMHWDGYGRDHKAMGLDKTYIRPDKDGYITSGLLWEPGAATYYCNGREVLRCENPRISNIQSDIMFTFVAGGWDNNSLNDAKLPDYFPIDYVRVWQRRDLMPAAAR